ncbi:MAG: hypothetical protein EXR01_08430 [Acetobacteraceae bacterium]|nr:hypothetical protein [Acetobacteraceae bacterium]
MTTPCAWYATAPPLSLRAPRGGDTRRIRDLRYKRPGFDHAIWRQMCDMGWLGLSLAEDHGGSGLGMREFYSLAEQLGASLVPEPLIPAALAARVLHGDNLAAALIGDKIFLPAWQE